MVNRIKPDPGFLPAVSANAPDPFTYTPMHAAASYGQLETLAYLVSQGQ
jgi:uncharacterized protein